MKTVTVFDDLRLEMDSFGDEWTDWLAILNNPKSSLKQKKLALRKMDMIV
jgi:hypothetical protein